MTLQPGGQVRWADPVSERRRGWGLAYIAGHLIHRRLNSRCLDYMAPHDVAGIMSQALGGDGAVAAHPMVGRCRLTLSNPR